MLMAKLIAKKGAAVKGMEADMGIQPNTKTKMVLEAAVLEEELQAKHSVERRTWRWTTTQ